MKLTRQQVENDLRAAYAREAQFREANENLRRDHALQSNALVQAMRERDDWRDAFKLIMKLVK